MTTLTWAEAVQTLRDDPGKRALVEACYFDDPVELAADRFWKSSEWQSIAEYLPETHGDALDLGAGRGISSYALARDGWNVTALEPDPSSLVGANAIRALSLQTGLAIKIVSEYSEHLPFNDASFDLVNCRQSLHHAHDLRQTCREIIRVLRPGGRMIATREHVISRPEDLQIFLDQHPLHHLYGGENAYLLSDYQSAIREAGLKLVQTIAPFDSQINYFPMTDKDIDQVCTSYFSRLVGNVIATRFVTNRLIGRRLIKIFRMVANMTNNAPGRLYSFIAVKPNA